MYNWFNKYLHLGLPEPVVEKPFVPVPPAELSVYEEQHPLPADATGAEGLRRYMSEASDRQIAALVPKDAKDLDDYRRIVGTALRVMIGDKLPAIRGVQEIKAKLVKDERGVSWRKLQLGRRGKGDRIPAVFVHGPEFNGTVVIWVHPAGKASLLHEGKLVPAAQAILDKHAAILAVDVFLTGEFQGAKGPSVDPEYAGFTFGYNRCLLANRVHDILTAVAYAKDLEGVKKIHLVGMEEAGPWILLARPLCGDAVKRTAADFHRFRFDQVHSTSDAMVLPGALKYGGLPALAALCAPYPLYVHNHRGTGSGEWLKTVYKAAGAADQLERVSEKAPTGKIIDWLMR
jgi:hypothetical protein